MRRLLAPLLFPFFVAACHKDAPPPPPPAATPPLAKEEAPKALAGDNVVTQLQIESTNRPKGIVTVEQVIEGIDAMGKKFSHQQVVALSLKARYCENGRTTIGLGMSICEFDDAEKAKAGRDRSIDVFKSFGKRKFALNGATLVTLGEPATSEIAADQEKFLEMFAKLTPR